MVGSDRVEAARGIPRITPAAKLVLLPSSESSLDAARSFVARAFDLGLLEVARPPERGAGR